MYDPLIIAHLDLLVYGVQGLLQHPAAFSQDGVLGAMGIRLK